MVIKNIYIIRILSTLFLFQHSLHAMRLANVAAVTKKYNNRAAHFSPNYSIMSNHNKRNQRTAIVRNAVSNNVSQHKPKQPVKTIVVPNSLVKQQNDDKKLVEQSKQNQTPHLALPVLKEDKPALLPNHDVKKHDASVRGFEQQPKVNEKSLDQKQESIAKKSIDHYDPYAHIQSKPFVNKHTVKEDVKKPKSITSKKKSTIGEEKGITDLYVKRLKEFNETRKKYIDQEEGIANIKVDTENTEHREKNNDDAPIVTSIVTNNDKLQNKNEPFQIGQLYANLSNTISNVFKPAEQNTEIPKNIEIVNGQSNNSKPVITESHVQFGEAVANTSNTMTNGLNAVWQYGKNSVKNVWNNCTSYDFWLKPYEMFSKRVIEKDPTTQQNVETIKGNLHAFLINQFGNEASTNAIYYLLRTGMVILGMALFCKPSLITDNGVGKVSVQLFSGLMQLITGGSLASVVAVITGGALKALPTALSFGSAQASADTIASATPESTWGQKVFGWAKNIGVTSVLNQLWSYKFRKEATQNKVKDEETQPDRLPNEQLPIQLTQDTAQKDAHVIPEKDLEVLRNLLENDPKANEDLYKLLLLSA